MSEQNERACPQRGSFDYGNSGDSIYFLALIEWRLERVENLLFKAMDKILKTTKKGYMHNINTLYPENHWKSVCFKP